LTDPPTRNPTGLGILSGLVLAGVLHLAASLAVIVIGGAVTRDGFYAVFPFWLALGLLQWIYLYPAARLARWRGWPGVTRGIWIAGGVTIALNVMQWALALTGPVQELLTGNSAARVEYSGNASRVVSTDAGHIVVREGIGDAPGSVAGDPETFVVTSETKFDFRGPAWREQTRPAGMDWLTGGRRLSVDYVVRRRQKQATLVLIWVEKKEPD
jgi:hypothetical protein